MSRSNCYSDHQAQGNRSCSGQRLTADSNGQWWSKPNPNHNQGAPFAVTIATIAISHESSEILLMQWCSGAVVVTVPMCEQWALLAPLGAAELYRDGSCCGRCLFLTPLMIRGHFPVSLD